MTLAGKRALFLLASLETGGAELQAIKLARALRRENMPVAVWTLAPHRGGPLTTALEGADLDVDTGVWQRDSRAQKARSLARIIKNMRAFAPDLVLPYTITPNLIAATTWRAAGARACVWNQRDALVIDVKRAAIARLASAWVSNSCHARDALIRQLRAPPERCFFVPNGVELRPAVDDVDVWRERLAIPAGRLVATMIAKLGTTKGQAFLIEVWRHLVDERGARAPVLVLAGRKDIGADDVIAAVRDNGLSEHVRIPGDVSDVSGLLAATDVAVFSSSIEAREGIPNGVLEPMAAGLPVVAVDVAGTREAFPVGSERHLVTAGDAKTFAARIAALADDAALRRRLGETHREHVARNFSLSAMTQRSIGVLEQVLS
jgi:glycosyltransferase involved in cell wall biosynthesis